MPLRQSFRRARGLPGAFWGGTLAHLGMGVAVIGMVGTSLWLTEKQAVMRPGDSVAIAGLTLTFERVERRRGPNYETEVGILTLAKDGRTLATLEPEQRWYPVAQQATVEAAIVPRWAHDVYVAMGEPRETPGGPARVVRVYHHPLVLWLWGGGLLMVAGGAISLTDRRYRVGAPARRARPEPQAVPA